MLPEVENYLLHDSKTPVSVETERPYLLTVEYSDGERRSMDMKPSLKGVFEELLDYELFSKAYTDGRCIMWDTPTYGTVDIDKDAFYIYGERLEPAVKVSQDPFYSDANMQYERKAVYELREGKGTTHDPTDLNE